MKTIADRVMQGFAKPTYKYVRPGFVTPRRTVPMHIPRPEYYFTGNPPNSSKDPFVAKQEDIPKIRAAARLARKMLDFACSVSKPGMTTEEVDILVHNEIIKHNAYPSPINYAGFPKAICTSVNDVVCHGIPDDRKLEDGDVLSIDVSVFKDGFHGDNCGTLIVGKSTDAAAERLIKATQEALDAAVSICKPGVCISKIGDTITEIANKHKYGIIHEFCGHGVGHHLHLPPLIMHFKNKTKLDMKPGMVFTIEPILVEGSRKMKVCDDEWTAYTVDGGRGAQFEHQLLITNDGHEVLTIPE